jgi:hypothetical protein
MNRQFTYSIVDPIGAAAEIDYTVCRFCYARYWKVQNPDSHITFIIILTDCQWVTRSLKLKSLFYSYEACRLALRILAPFKTTRTRPYSHPEGLPVDCRQWGPSFEGNNYCCRPHEQATQSLEVRHWGQALSLTTRIRGKSLKDGVPLESD